MRRQAVEVAVPVDRHDVGRAGAVAGVEEGREPREARRRARHRRRDELHAELPQGLEDADPRRGGELRRDVGAAGGGGAVGLVEGHDVGDVCAGFDEGGHGREEGGVGGGGRGAPEHGHELDVGPRGEVRGGRGLVVVIPCQAGVRREPDGVVGGVGGVGNVDEAALCGGADCGGEDGGEEGGEEEGCWGQGETHCGDEGGVAAR